MYKGGKPSFKGGKPSFKGGPQALAGRPTSVASKGGPRPPVHGPPGRFAGAQQATPSAVYRSQGPPSQVQGPSEPLFTVDFEPLPGVPYFYGAWSKKHAKDFLMGGAKETPKLAAAAPAAAAKKPWAKAAAEPAEQSVSWLKVSDDAPIVGNGYPVESPIVRYSPDLASSGILGASTTMLAQLLGDGTEGDIELVHDEEWVTFPEVGAAMRKLGLGEESICVALSPQQARWAVGVGGKWKQRENAARLALCVAFADQATPEFSAEWPDFAPFASGTTKTQPRRVSPLVAAPVATQASKKRKHAGGGDEAEAWGGPAPDDGPFARDTPHWIQLPADEPKPDAFEALGDDGLVVCSDGNRRKGLYSQADSALAILTEGKGDIEYIDDPNWSVFPQIGKALLAMGAREECMEIGVCAALNVWAVGMSGRKKNRTSATKAALVGAIGVHILNTEGALPDLGDCGQVVQFIEEAQAKRG